MAKRKQTKTYDIDVVKYVKDTDKNILLQWEHQDFIEGVSWWAI